LKKLLVNADDFGLSEGVCAGIVEALERGIVTSTTAMAAVPGTMERLARWASRLEGRVGAHLQATEGRPCLPPREVPSLVGNDGDFPASRAQVRGVNPAELKREWLAQLDRLALAGITPTHLDTHHHVHTIPGVFVAYCQVARERGLPARTYDQLTTRLLRSQGVACPDLLCTQWFGDHPSLEGLLEALETVWASLGGQGTIELMCHPGRLDQELGQRSYYAAQRERELAVLCAPETARALQERGITLVTASQLA
jgi:chitin disaccharide deacetylase